MRVVIQKPAKFELRDGQQCRVIVSFGLTRLRPNPRFTVDQSALASTAFISRPLYFQNVVSIAMASL